MDERPRTGRGAWAARAAFFAAAVFGGGYLLIQVTDRPFLWPFGVVFGLALSPDVPERFAQWLGRHGDGFLAIMAVRCVLGLGAVVCMGIALVRFVEALRSGPAPSEIRPAHLTNAIQDLLQLWLVIIVILIEAVGRQRSMRFVLPLTGAAFVTFGVFAVSRLDRDALGVAVLSCAVGTRAIFTLVAASVDRYWLSVATSTFLFAVALAWIPAQPFDSLLAAGIGAIMVDIPFADWNPGRPARVSRP